MSDWKPATEAEAAMREALLANDQEEYFTVLAQLDLLLPVAAGAIGGPADIGWGTWTSEGRTHVLGFTSPRALRECLATHAGPYRRLSFEDLAATWPNIEWWLAVNPGLPIEAYLPAWFINQINRGDIRLPGRTLGARARMEHARRLGGRAVAPARPAPPAAARDRLRASPLLGPVTAADSGAAAPKETAIILPGEVTSAPREVPMTPREVPRALPAVPPASAQPTQLGTGSPAAQPARFGSGTPSGPAAPRERRDADEPTAGVPIGSFSVRADRSVGLGKLLADSEALIAAAERPPTTDRPAESRPVESRPAESRPAESRRLGDVRRPAEVRRPDTRSGQSRSATNRPGENRVGEDRTPASRSPESGPDDSDTVPVLASDLANLTPPKRASSPWREVPTQPEPDRSPRGSRSSAGSLPTPPPTPPGHIPAPGSPISLPVSAPGAHAATPIVPRAATPIVPRAATPIVPRAATPGAHAEPSRGSAETPGAHAEPSGAPAEPPARLAESPGGHAANRPGEPSQRPPSQPAASQPTSAATPPPTTPPTTAPPASALAPPARAGRAVPDPGPVTPAPYVLPELPEAAGRVISFEPSNAVEEDLLEAAQSGHTDRFLSTLLLAKVLIPGWVGDDASFEPARLPTVDIDGAPHLLAFTSEARLVERLGADATGGWVKFTRLIAAWPGPAVSFAVNPQTAVGATLPGDEIVALANWAAELGLGRDPEPEPAAPRSPAPRPARTARPPDGPLLMQKPISPDQLPFYLDRGYDRVSGFVHRANEVTHLRTPEELYHGLGLKYSGSAFKPDAGEVYVLRWNACRVNLYRIPYGGQHEAAMRAMEGWVIERTPFRGNGFAPSETGDVIAEFKVDSVRLPHGAQLWRLDREGNERLVARLDADGPRWQRVAES